MNQKPFTRTCPTCSVEIGYLALKSRNNAEKAGADCFDCALKKVKAKNKEEKKAKYDKRYLIFDEEKNQIMLAIWNESDSWDEANGKAYPLWRKFKSQARPKVWTRNCPDCKCVIEYKTTSARNFSERNNSFCVNCAYKGERNPFYGKKHSKETIDKVLKTKETSPAWQAQVAAKRTPEYRAEASKNSMGKKNPRYGMGSLKDIWTRKYGAEEAEKRWNEWRAKESTASKGERNPMYGKPSPQGSGNGWSGWYKDWFFRSLGELSFMINVIERFNFQWKTGESRKYVVEYVDYAGQTRNYFPDFILNDKYLVEVKPKKLHDTPKILAKTKAARLFCEKNNLKFKIIAPKPFTETEILDMYLSGTIRFTDRYEEKFRKLRMLD